MGRDHGEEVPCLHPFLRENHHRCLRDDSCDQPRDKGKAPNVDGRVDSGPPAGVVAQADLKGEVDQNSEGHVFLAKPLVQKLEVRDCVVGLKPDFGNEVDNYDCLDILELEDPQHASVHLHYPVALLGPFFSFHEGETDGY